MLQDKDVPASKNIVGSTNDLPTLVVASWCPFTLPATELWKNAATAVGLTLKVVDAESEEGEQVMAGANVAGVPCLVAAQDRKYYGTQISEDEAKSFLKA
ncbi:MAG: hypothetical protein ACUZ8H_16580 [Candidatus Anammoxibacter sp.]